MGIFSGKKVKEGLQVRAARAVDNWIMPKTEYINNINSIDALYVVLTFLSAVGIAILLGGGGNGMLVSFLGAFLFVSRPVKSAIVPRLYDIISAKVGWLPYDEAIRADAVARGILTADGKSSATPNGGGDAVGVQYAIAEAELAAKAQENAPIQARMADAEGDVDRVKISRILDLWHKLSDDEQLERAQKVATVLSGLGAKVDVDAIAASKNPDFAASKILVGLRDQFPIAS